MSLLLIILSSPHLGFPFLKYTKNEEKEEEENEKKRGNNKKSSSSDTARNNVNMKKMAFLAISTTSKFVVFTGFCSYRISRHFKFSRKQNIFGLFLRL